MLTVPTVHGVAALQAQPAHARVSVPVTAVPPRCGDAKPVGHAFTPARTTHAASGAATFGAHTCVPGHPLPSDADLHVRPSVTMGGVETVAVHVGVAGGATFAKPAAGTEMFTGS